MSLYDFRKALELRRADEPFHALIMAAAMKADSDNIERLRLAFPETVAELEVRYNAPGGHHPQDGER